MTIKFIKIWLMWNFLFCKIIEDITIFLWFVNFRLSNPVRNVSQLTIRLSMYSHMQYVMFLIIVQNTSRFLFCMILHTLHITTSSWCHLLKMNGCHYAETPERKKDAWLFFLSLSLHNAAHSFCKSGCFVKFFYVPLLNYKLSIIITNK